MPRKEQGWVTFQTSDEERKLLDEFCQLSQRTKTEILRELVRGLGKQSLPSAQIPTKQRAKKNTAALELEDTYTLELEVSSKKKPLKVSSRNILKGVITEIVTGSVNSEVTLEIVHRVKLTSVITKVSVDELELAVGEEAYAVVKSTDIVIAKE
jgi:molybdopterin-binding protein